jgi:hypothetical protein
MCFSGLLCGLGTTSGTGVAWILVAFHGRLLFISVWGSNANK